MLAGVRSALPIEDKKTPSLRGKKLGVACSSHEHREGSDAPEMFFEVGDLLFNIFELAAE
jgi:hypothetical protein